MNYFDRPEISNSDMTSIKRSIRTYLHNKEKRKQLNELLEKDKISKEDFESVKDILPTSQMILGSGVHELVLEDKEPIESDWKTVCMKYLKDSGKVLNGQSEQIYAMTERLKADPVARCIFEDGKKESEIYFNHLEVDCRSKIDFYNDKIIRDLKTIDDIEKVERKVKYEYYRQAAFYQLAVSYETGKLLPFVFVFVDKKEPYECCVRGVGENLLMKGRLEIEKYLNKWKDYENKMELFDGHSNEIGIIDI